MIHAIACSASDFMTISIDWNPEVLFSQKFRKDFFMFPVVLWAGEIQFQEGVVRIVGDHMEDLFAIGDGESLLDQAILLELVRVVE